MTLLRWSWWFTHGDRSHYLKSFAGCDLENFVRDLTDQNITSTGICSQHSDYSSLQLPESFSLLTAQAWTQKNIN